MIIRTVACLLISSIRAAGYTLQDSVAAAAVLLGTYKPCSGNYCNWMSPQYWGDSTLLQMMTIPGTHDSATWRFGTDVEWTILLDGLVRCQTVSIFDQLDGGVRFLDLRFGVSATGPMQLLMHHGPVQLDTEVQLQDIVAGVAYWLTQNPTETVLVSLKQDDQLGSSRAEAEFAKLFTNETLAPHWVQLDNTLPTLGDARGKLVLLSRYSALPKEWGLRVNDGWLDDNPYFEISVPKTNIIVSIEDAYTVPSGIGDTPLQVSWKADKAMAQMERAAQYITSAYTASTPLTSHSATLFITFVSGTRAAVAEILKDLGNLGSIYTTPHELALGNNGLGVIPTMIDYLGRKRHFPGSQLQFGIVVFDFVTDIPGTIDALLGLDNQPAYSRRDGPARLPMDSVDDLAGDE